MSVQTYVVCVSLKFLYRDCWHSMLTNQNRLHAERIVDAGGRLQDL